MTELQTPFVGSILLASTDPSRLRAWYQRAFDVPPDTDGFVRLGEVGLLIVPRDDVAASTAEPARVIINLHVTDARAAARHLDALKVTWLAPLEYREPDGAWFGTVSDPDGNYVQIIELTPAYWSARHQRAPQAGRGRWPTPRSRRGYPPRIWTAPGSSTPRSSAWSPPKSGQAGSATSAGPGPSPSSTPAAGQQAPTRSWPGRSATSTPSSPN